MTPASQLKRHKYGDHLFIPRGEALSKMFWPKRVCGEIPFEIFHSIYRNSPEEYLELLEMLEKSKSRHDFLLWVFDIITAGRKRNVFDIYDDILDQASERYFPNIEYTVNACRKDCHGSLAEYMVKEYPFLFEENVAAVLERKGRFSLSTLEFFDEKLWKYRNSTLDKFVHKIFRPINLLPVFYVNPMKNLTIEDFTDEHRGRVANEFESEDESESKPKAEVEKSFEAEEEGSASEPEIEAEKPLKAEEKSLEYESDLDDEDDGSLQLEFENEPVRELKDKQNCDSGFKNDEEKHESLKLGQDVEAKNPFGFGYEDYDLAPAIEYFSELLTYVGMVPGRNECIIMDKNAYKQKQAEKMMKKIRTKRLVSIDCDKALKLAHKETIVVAKIMLSDESFVYERAQILLDDAFLNNGTVQVFCVDTGKCPMLPLSDIFIYDLKNFQLTSFREEIIFPTLEKKEEKTYTLAERVPHEKLSDDLQFNDFFSYDCGLTSGGIPKYIPCGRPMKHEDFFEIGSVLPGGVVHLTMDDF